MKKNCVICGKGFRTLSGSKKTCSEVCRYKRYEESRRRARKKWLSNPKNRALDKKIRKSWGQKNKDKRCAAVKRYYQRNREKVLSRQRQWYQIPENRSLAQEASRKWAKENRNRCADNRKKWRAIPGNRESLIMHCRNRRVRVCDNYAARLLGLDQSICPPALIACKRAQIQLKRLLKEQTPCQK